MNSKIINKVNNNKVLAEIKKTADVLRSELNDGENLKLYLVGGAIRDFILDVENFDKDLVVVNFDAEILAEKLSRELDATMVELDSGNCIYRVVLSDKLNYIDIANALENSIEKDLKRRDLTVNSIAVDIFENKIIDINNGLKDFCDKKIRLISEQNVLDDPLRILRAFRFMSTLGFDLDEESREILIKNVKYTLNPAKERINYELIKLMGGKNAHNALLEMDSIGILTEILPIMIDVKKVPPNSHHHLDLIHHCIETVRQIQIIYETFDEDVKKDLKSVEFGAASRLAHLKFAGLLHDIGKFSTWTIEESGKHRFIKHDIVGADMAKDILKSMGFSKKQIEYIVQMIKYHLYPSQIVCSPECNEKTYMRYVRKIGNLIGDNIILAMADRYSALGEDITDEIVKNNIDGLTNLLKFYTDIKDSLEPLPKLLSGNEIMELLNIKPSRRLGEIISALEEAQISGDVTNRDEAIRFINTL